jgi:hypothetical protein
VGAAREQRRQYHQVGQREEPLLRLRACGFCRSRDHTQVTAAREVMKVLHADTRQAGYFGIREDFLTRLYLNQGASLILPL